MSAAQATTQTETSEGTPLAEAVIDAGLVQRLLRAQHADLAHSAIQLMGEGWDNVMFKLGETMLVRLPRRNAAAALILHEQTWLPHLAQQLLKVRSRNTYPSFRRLAAQTNLITPQIEQIWQAAVDAPAATEAKWLHGDLHPRNVLVHTGLSHAGLPHAGTFSGIIDWGDITSGDVATDLAAAWMLFSCKDAQNLVLSRYGASKAEIARAKGWAVSFAVFLLETGLVDNSRNVAIGKQILVNLQR